jgi:hypothetical protein
VFVTFTAYRAAFCVDFALTRRQQSLGESTGNPPVIPLCNRSRPDYPLEMTLRNKDLG